MKGKGKEKWMWFVFKAYTRDLEVFGILKASNVIFSSYEFIYNVSL